MFLPVRRRVVLLTAAAALTTSAISYAWWDTWIKTWRPVPLVREYEAETCKGFPADAVKDDPQGNGGVGSKAVLLNPGGPGLTVELDDLRQGGIYALFAISRAADDNADLPRKPAFATLKVLEHASNTERSWTMQITHRERYFAAVQMYFPTHAGGTYTATLSLTDKSEQPLLVDRLELRDALGNCLTREPVKTRRMLTSDEELAQIRKAYAEGANKRLQIQDRESFNGPPAPRTPEERRARNEILWNKVPDFNAHTGHGDAAYGEVIGRDRPGIIANAADAWEKTGNAEFGWDGAVTLCSLAEKFPALDYFAQAKGGYTNLDRDKDKQPPFHFSAPPGKFTYRGWSGSDMLKLTRSYDKLFDFIKDNRALAEYVGTKIPWVKTPKDVVRLLDTNLLQAGWDASVRGYIEGSDAVKALIPLVLGVGPISDKMLDQGIFTKISMNMTYAGGIDDQAVCSYNRDGVHYIGSTGYVAGELEEIAKILEKYVAAGGNPRYNIADPKRLPQMRESQSTVEQLRVAGGFPLVIGDAMDLRRGRDANWKPYPSRVLAGFGAAILESGQFQPSPLKQRAVGMHFGIGRGHAHQDTLNLEILALGCRVAPDLGGRHEGRLRGSPNMRWNRVHNLVEVDDTNFENPYAGSTVSATGWIISFDPLPGAQFMAAGARATSHPYVSLYQRDTALIDVDDTNSYIFDVFRVRGGKVHTYCFHGARSKQLKINVDLKDATSADAVEYLRKHKEGTHKEGVAPALIEADWPMDQDLQQAYQGMAYTPDKVVTMRLALLGRQGNKVLVGNATSEAYAYDFPFLYVRNRQETDGAETVWPAIMEPYAGQPFIRSKTILPVTSEAKGALAPVALNVQTDRASDILYSSGAPGIPATVEGGMKVTGRFAMYSTDAEGLRTAYLVGGTELTFGDVSIKTERAAWEGRIRRVDYPNRTFVLDQPLPEKLLVGQWACIDNGKLTHNFRLASLQRTEDGTKIVHEKTACYYQSPIVAVDPEAGAIESMIEPVVFGCDTRFCDGTTVTNEAQDSFWKAQLEEGDRWMNLGFPGYRGSSPNKLTWAHFPDADGDGKRTLKMYGSDADKDEAGNSLKDKLLLTLEITRIADDGETIYFKLPADEKYRRGGWQFAYRRLENEDRSFSWEAMYPGSSFRWKLTGTTPVTKESFRDADGDGKSKISAWLFGPGDTMRLDTYVHVTREVKNGYTVSANVPCTITLPGPGPVQLSKDRGTTFARIPATIEGQRVTIRLDADALDKGEVQIKIGN